MPIAKNKTEIQQGYDSRRTYHSQAGSNSATSTSWEVINLNGSVSLPTSPETSCYVSSSSTSDTSAGTGARTVRITYMVDANCVEITEDITMNGQSSVNLANDVFRVNKIEVLTVGSSDYNLGNIYVGNGINSSGVPSNVLRALETEFSKDHDSHITVPANKTCYITKILATQQNVSAHELVRLVTQNVASGSPRISELEFQFSNADGFEVRDMYAIAVPEKTDIWLQCKASNGAPNVNSYMEYVLYDYS